MVFIPNCIKFDWLMPGFPPGGTLAFFVVAGYWGGATLLLSWIYGDCYTTTPPLDFGIWFEMSRDWTLPLCVYIYCWNPLWAWWPVGGILPLFGVEFILFFGLISLANLFCTAETLLFYGEFGITCPTPFGLSYWLICNPFLITGPL